MRGRGPRRRPIPEEIQAEFRSRDPELWDWIGNPVDGSILAGAGFGEGEILERMAASPSYDVLIGNIAEFWAMERPGAMTSSTLQWTIFSRPRSRSTNPSCS